jgi:diadenylate cyclase
VTLFKIIEIGVIDLVEISLVSYILYRLYQLMRGTIAVQISLGLGALYLIQVLVSALNIDRKSVV